VDDAHTSSSEAEKNRLPGGAADISVKIDLAYGQYRPPISASSLGTQMRRTHITSPLHNFRAANRPAEARASDSLVASGRGRYTAPRAPLTSAPKHAVRDVDEAALPQQG
jgi:hypothetical protein